MHGELFKFFLNKKLPHDEPNIHGESPFSIHLKLSQNVKSEIAKTLLDLDVNIDIKDKAGDTLFLHFYNMSIFALCYELIKQGADVNHMNKKGDFALKMSVNRRDFKEISNLVDNGADINKKDHKMRTLLHHAVNVSQPTTEANFDLEKVLIKKGIDMNTQDI